MLEIVRSGWGVQLHVILGADDGQVHCLGACKRLACMLNVCHVLGWAQGCFQGQNSIAKFASKQKKQESDYKIWTMAGQPSLVRSTGVPQLTHRPDRFRSVSSRIPRPSTPREEMVLRFIVGRELFKVREPFSL